MRQREESIVQTKKYHWLHWRLAAIGLFTLLLFTGCRENPQTVLPTPDLDLLAPTATVLTARIEVVVVVVTATPQSPEIESSANTDVNTASAANNDDEATTEPAETQDTSAQTQSMSNQQLINMGENVYSRNCASCHQNSGEGNSNYPALNNSAFLTMDDPTQIIQLVLYGRGEMPSFEDNLSNQQIAAALSYARNAWTNDATVVRVSQVRAVRQGGNASQAGPSTAATLTSDASAEMPATGTATNEAVAATSSPAPATATTTVTITATTATTSTTEAEAATETVTPAPQLTATVTVSTTPTVIAATTSTDTSTDASMAISTPLMTVTVTLSDGITPPATWTPERAVTPFPAVLATTTITATEVITTTMAPTATVTMTTTD